MPGVRAAGGYLVGGVTKAFDIANRAALRVQAGREATVKQEEIRLMFDALRVGLADGHKKAPEAGRPISGASLNQRIEDINVW